MRLLTPNLEALVITPLAAHSLAFRPIVVGSDRVVELEIEEANDNGPWGTTLVLDGQVQHRVRTGDRVLVEALPGPVQLVSNPSWDYWSTLMRKLHWASQPGPDPRIDVR